MTQEIKTIDDLFDLIDNELIILSEAKQKGKYKWFDFVAALRVLDDRIQNAEYNKYRSRKVSNLIKVLNDLYYTPVQTCCKRILSYDKERKIATSEWHISGKDARVELVENEVPFQKQAHYESLRLPEENFTKLCDTFKFSYLLRGCEIDYSNLESTYFSGTEIPEHFWEEWDFYLFSEQQKEFRRVFNANVDLDENTITFEKYIMQLKAERNVLRVSTGADRESVSNNSYFSVNRSYPEIQRILSALQQQGFVSTDTTVETFYYRMTGKGVSTPDKIEWIKKGKRRKREISKSSLVYFLQKFANYNVDQTSDCKNRIKEVFGISLPSSTITRSSNCEYGAEIDNILSVQ